MTSDTTYEVTDEHDDRQWIAIGHGVEITYTQWHEHDPAGLIERHPRPDGRGWCMGGVMFDLPGIRERWPAAALWTVESLEPLTLSPSIRCHECGHHGYIRDDAWEPA